MDFTFGIITAGGADSYIQTTVSQIRKQQIPNYEIIIVGQTDVSGSDIINIPFDESIKKGWITRKKNIIAQTARYDTIVFMHDYVSIDDDWYKGFLQFGSNFDICTNRIIKKNGERFYDLIFFHSFGIIPFNNKFLVPYDCTLRSNIKRLIYMPGYFYVVKRTIALQFPLDETLVHNMGEDILFTFQLILNDFDVSFNTYSKSHLLKEKGFPKLECADIQTIEYINSKTKDEITDIVFKSFYLQKSWICTQMIQK